MSTPDEAVQATLADQAAASAPPSDVPNLPLEAAVPSEADVDALREQLAAAEAARAAATPPPVPEPVGPAAPQVSGGSGELQAALAGLHERLLAVEQWIASMSGNKAAE